MDTHDGPTEAVLAEEFPVLDRWTYLNHAAISPWPASTQRAVAAFGAENRDDGPAHYRDWLAVERDLRARAARLLGAATAREISLVPNTTEGVCIVAGGLDWRDGDNIVTAAGEFPTNRLAWAALAERGVSLRTVDLHADLSPEAAVERAMDERTRVVALSAVQWMDGLRLDLARIGSACREAGVLFFVDAIQQFGALRLDVQVEQIDCLAAGAHKWQLGPEGIGVFYCRSAWRERLRPLKRGWRMLERPFDFDRPDRKIARDGHRFEAGSPNSLGQVALNASLALQERYGQDWIEARVLSNTLRLIQGIQDIPGLRLVSESSPARRSGIVSFRPERGAPEQLVRDLASDRVVAVARGGLVRLSPHFYQGKAVVERVLEALEEKTKRL